MHESIIHHLTNRNNICPRIEGDRSSSETVKKQERKGERGEEEREPEQGCDSAQFIADRIKP